MGTLPWGCVSGQASAVPGCTALLGDKHAEGIVLATAWGLPSDYLSIYTFWHYPFTRRMGQTGWPLSFFPLEPFIPTQHNTTQHHTQIRCYTYHHTCNFVSSDRRAEAENECQVRWSWQASCGPLHYWGTHFLHQETPTGVPSRCLP